MLSILLPILSVVIGFIIAVYLKRETRATQYLLSFSGAFLLSILVFEFLPHVYEDYNPIIGVMVMAGVLLQVLLEFLSKEIGRAHV